MKVFTAALLVLHWSIAHSNLASQTWEQPAPPLSCVMQRERLSAAQSECTFSFAHANY